MGFYVNLEMPKNCPMCPFAHYDDMFNTFRGCDITRGKRWAVKNDKDYAKLSTRPDWCPLIEVPEPHGRLIDANAVTLECGPYEYDDWCKWALEQYQDAPTVIPATEEEKHEKGFSALREL